MADFLTIAMLPAREGDALWLTYGSGNDTFHILYDAGRSATTSAVRDRLAAARGPVELVVISHVDRDHIEGMLALTEARFDGADVRDIWFNAYEHLSGNVVSFGAAQGERLGEALQDNNLPWNKEFARGPVVTDTASPRVITLPSGMKLTLLSPTTAKLRALKPVWETECEKAGLKPGLPPKPSVPAGLVPMGPLDVDALAGAPFKADTSEANGSSIAVLAEYAGRRVLLAADIHEDALRESLTSIGGGSRVALSAFKLPHHCSRHNISRAVLDLIECDRYLVSSNGSYFHHPDSVAVSRTIKFGGSDPELIFNYRSDESEVWDDAALKSKHGYRTRYPVPGSDGFQTIDLPALPGEQG